MIDAVLTGSKDTGSSRIVPDHARAFVVLDGFRGIAALCVAFGHGRFLAAGTPTPFFDKSYLAVDFFFLLSGFVLEHAYAAALRDGLGPVRFLILRLIRLYPLYLLALLSSASLTMVQSVIGPPGTSAHWGDWLAAALLLPSPGSPDYLFPLNIPAWSLFFELIANAGFAAFRGRLPTRLLAAIVAGAGALIVAGVLGQWWGFGGAGGAVNVGVTWSSFSGGLLRVIFSFFAGVLLYRWRGHVPTIPAFFPALSLLVILAAHPGQSWQAGFDVVAVLGVFPAVLLLGAAARPRQSTGLWLRLGALSFGVYVLQMFAYTLVRWIGSVANGGIYPGLSNWAVVTIVLGLALAAAALDRFYDRRARQWLKANLLGHARSQ